MDLSECLKKHGIKRALVAHALGIDPRNLNRYNDLRQRSINEVILIHNTTKIPYKDLIGTELKD